MSRVIKCDRCGHEVDPKKIGYVSIMQRSEAGDLKGDNPFENMDFCENCMTLIADFISAKAASAGGKNQKHPGGASAGTERRRKLDAGKIRALANAGWSQAKIAEEMGCSVPTVARYLKEG